MTKEERFGELCESIEIFGKELSPLDMAHALGCVFERHGVKLETRVDAQDRIMDIDDDPLISE